MKRGIITLGIAIVSFALGAASVLLLRKTPNASMQESWINTVPAVNPVMFDLPAIRSDVPVPKPGKLEGRVKFLNRDNGIQIGYVLKLRMNANPVSPLPEQYRRTTVISGFDVGPPDQVSYTGEFTFTLNLGDHPKPATCGHLKTGHSE